MNAATNQPSILTLRLGQSDQAGQRCGSCGRDADKSQCTNAEAFPVDRKGPIAAGDQTTDGWPELALTGRSIAPSGTATSRPNLHITFWQLNFAALMPSGCAHICTRCAQCSIWTGQRLEW